MNQECTERIRSCYAQLYSDMRADEVIPVLFARNALSDQDFDYLHSHCRSEREKNQYILIYIIMRGPIESFHVLKQALKDTNQTHLYDLLSDDAAAAVASAPAAAAEVNGACAQQVPADQQEVPLSPPEEFDDVRLAPPTQCSDDTVVKAVISRSASVIGVAIDSAHDVTVAASAKAEPVEHVFIPGVCESVEDLLADERASSAPGGGTLQEGVHAASAALPHGGATSSWAIPAELSRQPPRSRKHKMKRRWHTLSTVHVVHTTSFES